MKAVWFAQFYLLCSLPSHYPSQAPPYQEPFYGVSRTGLGKGKLNQDYQGHVMWDNEFYLLPAILPFHPNLAKYMLRYRYFKLDIFRARIVRLGYSASKQCGWSYLPSAVVFLNLHYDFYRTTRCESAVFAVVRCPFVRHVRSVQFSSPGLTWC